MLSAEYFDLLVQAMYALALLVFVCLYFVNAGYGQFRSQRWGWSVSNRWGWLLMEAPVFAVMLAIWLTSGRSLHAPEIVLFCLFELHYLQRSFVFPFLMSGKGRMPVAIMLMGIVFNSINGLLQGGALFWYPNPDYAEGAAYLLRTTTMLGVLLFFIGMGINLHSDNVIRHLRQPGDTHHYLPDGGLYHWVTSANYFGELLEWTGFALAAATPAAWVFPVWTAANLVPRAHAIHKRYCLEFGHQAVGKRKRIIPFIY